MTVDFVKLHDKPLSELIDQARELGVPQPVSLLRGDLVFAIIKEVGQQAGVPYGRGVLEVHGEGFGFLRSPADNYLPGNDDIYVSQSQIRRFKLQTGDTVIGMVRAPKEGERYLALLRVETVNGDPPGQELPSFETLVATYPDERLPLTGSPELRALDMVAPLGLGQRGIIVAPNRTGRVELLRSLANALIDDDDLDVTVLLLGERPEEIHEWRESTRAEVIATPFDEAFSRHLQVADIVFERARRQAERGDCVVLLVDSLTRLLRACLAELPPTGRDIGGVDTAALHRIRRYLGSARALKDAGALTVLGVVSAGRESPLDDALLQDLREVVNWEVFLSRDLADRGIRPPLDVSRSGTRRQERLLEPEELEERRRWRASLTGDLVEDGAALATLASSAAALDAAS